MPGRLEGSWLEDQPANHRIGEEDLARRRSWLPSPLASGRSRDGVRHPIN